ncbi:MAG: class I SAM-dependent methyltransferase [Acidimicrobiales bacterium]
MTSGAPTDRATLQRQYADGSTLDARSSIYAWQTPRHDLVAEVARHVDPTRGPVIDVGCGRGQYLGGVPATVGIDLSPGLAAAAGAASGRPTLVGDAIALPLPDAVAGTALALHMLYHLPDPADGLRELRRITRIGGRIVVLTNGIDHLAAYRELVRDATGLGAALAWPGTEFSLEHRPLVESILGPVELVELRARVDLPGISPLVGYLEASRDFYETQGGRPWPSVVERFTAAAIERVESDGTFVLRSHSGLFVADR